MSKREKIIFVILAGVALYTMLGRPTPKKSVLRQGLPSRPVAMKAVKFQEPDFTQADLDRVVKQLKAVVPPVQGNSPVLDPFKKIEVKVAKKELGVSDLVLTGIISDEKGTLAVINNNIYRKGDKILDYMIEEISDAEVILGKGAERHILKIFPTDGNGP